MAEIEVLEERMDNLIVTNKKEHAEILAKLTSITYKLDNLPNDFPTRTEFTATSEAFATANSSTKERIKAIENILKGAGGVIGVAILTALLKLVLK